MGFDESAHPRASDGKWTSGGGGGSKKSKASAPATVSSGNPSLGGKTGWAAVPLDDAFTHVVKGQHAKAKAIFDAHGQEVPKNVQAMGKKDGFDYSKPQTDVPKPPSDKSIAKSVEKKKADAVKALQKQSAKELADKAKSKAKIDAARVKAQKVGAAVIEKAKARAATVKAGAAAKIAQHEAMLKSGQAKNEKAVHAKIAKIREAAEVKASKIVADAKAKAKERADATVAKAGGAPADKKNAAGPQPGRPLTDGDLQTARYKVESVANAYERSAALVYSGHSYEQINGGLRSGNLEGGKEIGSLKANELHDTIGRLDSLLDKCRTTSPVLTYRGSTAIPTLTNLKPGETFVDKAYMSTTTDRATTSEFAGEHGIVMHITSPAGTKIAGIPSKYPDEKEMLLGRGTALRLDRREVVDGQHVFHMTVVAQH